MSHTLLALLGFTSWALALLVLMEAIRSKLVLTREVAANSFNPANSNLSPFMQRLARAHARGTPGTSMDAAARRKQLAHRSATAADAR